MKARMLTRYEFALNGFTSNGTCDIWAAKVRKAWPNAAYTATRVLLVGARPKCFEPECKVCPK